MTDTSRREERVVAIPWSLKLERLSAELWLPKREIIDSRASLAEVHCASKELEDHRVDHGLQN